MTTTHRSIRDAPIGIFDSGLGGLTVLREVIRRLPCEDIVYLGDTVRVPYGVHSARTVRCYAELCARHLARRQVKAVVVACNTVSAVALEVLRAELDVPVLGIIEAGVEAAMQLGHGRHLGIISTSGTARSGVFQSALRRRAPAQQVSVHATPMLVALVEAGWLDGEVTAAVVRECLQPLVAKGVDCLLLACTHFPLLRSVIEQELVDLSGHCIPVVDAGTVVAEELVAGLSRWQLGRGGRSRGHLSIELTGITDRFYEMCCRSLGFEPRSAKVRAIDLSFGSEVELVPPAEVG